MIFPNIVVAFQDVVEESDRALEAMAQDAGDVGIELLERPTTTWSRRVTFVAEVNNLGSGIYETEVSTTDPIYGYLNYGTRVRRVILSRDWSSKTSVGSLSASKGAGRVVFGPSMAIARPGIQAREFDRVAVETIEDQDLLEPTIKKHVKGI